MGRKRGLARQALSRKVYSLYATKPATSVRDAAKKNCKIHLELHGKKSLPKNAEKCRFFKGFFSVNRKFSVFIE